MIAARTVLEALTMTGIVCAETNCSVLEVKKSIGKDPQKILFLVVFAKECVEMYVHFSQSLCNKKLSARVSATSVKP